MDIMNSHRFRCWHASASSSKLALSSIQMPIATMPTWWMGLVTCWYWRGITSLPVSEPIMAMLRSWNRGRQAAWQAVEPVPAMSHGPSTSRRCNWPVRTSRMSPSSTRKPQRRSASKMSSGIAPSPRSSQSMPRTMGTSTSTARVVMPSFATSTDSTVAPKLVETRWAGRPLYIFPSQKK